MVAKVTGHKAADKYTTHLYSGDHCGLPFVVTYQIPLHDKKDSNVKYKSKSNMNVPIHQ